MHGAQTCNLEAPHVRVPSLTVMSNIDKLIGFEIKQPHEPYGNTIVGPYTGGKLHPIKGFRIFPRHMCRARGLYGLHGS